jgi:hypothetical protein
MTLAFQCLAFIEERTRSRLTAIGDYCDVQASGKTKADHEFLKTS